MSIPVALYIHLEQEFTQRNKMLDLEKYVSATLKLKYFKF